MFEFDPGQVRPQVQPPAVQGGPLGGLQGQVGSVLSSAGYRPPRPGQTAEAMAKGAAIGFGGWLLWRGMKARKQRVGEFTHPFFRFVAIWWAFMIVGFALSLGWVAETGYFLGTAFVLGTLLSFAYAVYRFTGHGRYNTRRTVNPWRGRP